MDRRLFLQVSGLSLVAPRAFAAAELDLETPFASIDGGDIRLSDWAGRPIMVVNTASLCAFTDQYAGLQALYDRYRDQGLIVLAVPSDDFNQELGSNDEVKDFCEVVFGLDLPMTEITPVRGRKAHPFYRSLAQSAGFTPRWNFNKVLLDGTGDLVETFDSRIDPMSPQVLRQIEALLR
ncbi:glutathione peroxidase [Yoonia litorea]|uniref:glutathione peroxidase n=1 Tax=Yoonia litorea TaxID=1123755 RepID=UPI0035CAC1DC